MQNERQEYLSKMQESRSM